MSERAGKTEKISISLERAELAVVRRRARRLYDGNLSAVIAEGVRRVREEEAREEVVRWLGTTGNASNAARDAIRAEWRDEPKIKRKKRAARP